MEKLKVPSHTQFPNIIIDNFMLKMTGAQIKVILAIARKTIGWHKISDRISYSQLCKLTGLSTNALKAGIKGLIEMNLISQEKTKFGYCYDMKYEGVSINDTAVSLFDTEVSKSDTIEYQKVIPQKKKETNKKETNKKEKKEAFKNAVFIYYKQITGKERITNIPDEVGARFEEGYTVDDAKKVIFYKHLKWWEDKKTREWVNLKTLFRPSHFGEYLSQAESELSEIEEEKYKQFRTSFVKENMYKSDEERKKVHIPTKKEWEHEYARD